MSGRGKRKASGTYDFEEGHMQFSVPTVKRVNFTSTSDSGSYSTSSVLGTLPTQSIHTVLTPSPGISQLSSDSDAPQATKSKLRLRPNAMIVPDIRQHVRTALSAAIFNLRFTGLRSGTSRGDSSVAMTLLSLDMLFSLDITANPAQRHRMR
ncbi:hypothetical protein B0H14DRAFT_2638880 [Mycena olivaceomarginata]|nr:hypothetical protein B0H14DRAFT_2638880 [Mycena olivaceomarginata]